VIFVKKYKEFADLVGGLYSSQPQAGG